jgi:hypothetical protein
MHRLASMRYMEEDEVRELYTILRWTFDPLHSAYLMKTCSCGDKCVLRLHMSCKYGCGMFHFQSWALTDSRNTNPHFWKYQSYDYLDVTSGDCVGVSHRSDWRLAQRLI